MTQAKHTPALFQYSSGGDKFITPDVELALSRSTCNVAAIGLSDEQARLIAAAPDLLKWAIEYTSNANTGESGSDYAIRMDAAFNGLRTAISKATGSAA